MSYAKDPNEKKDYRVDWTAHLAGDTIASSTWTVATGLTQAAPAPSSTTSTATIWLSGGSAGVDYKVTNTVTTTQGRIFERSFVVAVQDL